MARKTKRRTKHRGNAAGMIESRGRTSARSAGSAGTAKGRKAADLDPRLRPPTWKSAFYRAIFASVIFVIVMTLVGGGSPVGALLVGAVLLAVYTPFGFYTDQFFWKRRVAKLTRGS